MGSVYPILRKLNQPGFLCLWMPFSVCSLGSFLVQCLNFLGYEGFVLVKS